MQIYIFLYLNIQDHYWWGWFYESCLGWWEKVVTSLSRPWALLHGRRRRESFRHDIPGMILRFAESSCNKIENWFILRRDNAFVVCTDWQTSRTPVPRYGLIQKYLRIDINTFWSHIMYFYESKIVYYLAH